jgi:class 3 adenylate cyclase
VRRSVGGCLAASKAAIVGVVRSEVQYTSSDGLHIAFRVGGEGPLDLVVCEPSMASFDHLSDFPPWAAFIDRLASFARVITFDRRGTGLSDRPSRPEQISLEARADDLLAVLDAVESERAAVLGVAAGSWAGFLFAASHPGRVSALILHHPRVRGLKTPEYPWGDTLEGIAEWDALVERAWGTREWAADDMAGHSPSLASDPQLLDCWAAVARRSSTIAEELENSRLEAQMDVSGLLPAIRVPTLVIHKRGDPAQSRYIADRIPGSELVCLGDRDMAPFAGDVDVVPETIRRFLMRLDTDIEPDRVLATILFTDIVRSTEHTRSLGDRRWRQLIDEHHAVVRGQLARFRGREIDTAGDGFLASFDGPARALRCACRIRDSVRDLGVEIRAGLHTGECEQAEGKLVGVAVHTASRVAGQAGASEVLVSSTVRELVAGAPFVFIDRGLHQLKGVEEWRLYSANESGTTILESPDR